MKSFSQIKGRSAEYARNRIKLLLVSERIDCSPQMINMLKKLRFSMVRHWQLYLLLLPTLVFFVMFKYIPMLGVQIAFRDYWASKGIWGSNWVGLKHFSRFFSSYASENVIRNTIILSVYQLLLTFPFPIILALMLNNVTNTRYKKIVQTVTYMPHFISTVVLVSTMMIMFSPSVGIVNHLLKRFGFDEIYFFGDAAWFRHLYVISAVWQTTGWNSIIYLAALTSIDPSLHEAAMIDGATKLQRVRHIDLPGIAPTIVVMLILASGNLMSIGHEKVYLMQTSLNLDTSEIISTYVYKIGLLNNQFSYSTAINLFNSVINAVILVSVNSLSRKISDSSLW